MASPALRIPVEIDTGGGFQSFKQSLDSAHKHVEDTTKHMTEDFKNINPDAANIADKFQQMSTPLKEAGSRLGLIIGSSIGLAITVGIAGALKAVDTLSKMGDMADDMRLPVNTIQALKVAATEARVPLETMNKALEKFTEVSKQNEDDAAKFYKALEIG